MGNGFLWPLVRRVVESSWFTFSTWVSDSFGRDLVGERFYFLIPIMFTSYLKEDIFNTLLVPETIYIVSWKIGVESNYSGLKFSKLYEKKVYLLANKNPDLFLIYYCLPYTLSSRPTNLYISTWGLPCYNMSKFLNSTWSESVKQIIYKFLRITERKWLPKESFLQWWWWWWAFW